MSENKEQQWRVEPMKIHGWAIHDADGNVVVKDIYDEEIARFIVRAANAHEALIEALIEALQSALRESGCDGDLCNYRWHEKARAALALVEKDS